MNFTIIYKILGIILMCEGGLLLIPLSVAVIFGESNTYIPFIVAILISLVLGGILKHTRCDNNKIGYEEGYIVVTLGWLIISLIGALPFYIEGTIPFYLDAFFETISGFTTTGVTVIEDIEIVPNSLIFWRSFTQWIGGMGILVLTLAVIPSIGGSLQVLNAESPGPMSDKKIVPSVSKTAQVLYVIIAIITLLEIILLFFGGMSLFDAVIHSFTTVGTGGFTSRNQSIGSYNSLYIEVVIIIFMIISGTNFTLYFLLFKNKTFDFFKNEEFRFYIILIIVSTVLISVNLFGNVFMSFGQSLRHAVFQVSSTISTTCFVTGNYDIWPDFSKVLLILLMLMGGCAGSTAGSIKLIRILILFKNAKCEMFKLFHPNAVMSVKIDGKTIPDKIIKRTTNFFFLFILIIFVATLIITLQGLDLLSALSAVIATLSNVGIGFGLVGPTCNYSSMTFIMKITLIMCMLIGRLEIYTVLILLMPSFWKD
ncbi:MAG TPA: TrkH family potassium uptake protein [Thermoanaerobacterales bacterium]|nr:TrkH family potassium uptake protein [Thermoanaerobacterales bacterium]